MICPECNKIVNPLSKFSHKGADGKYRHAPCTPKAVCQSCKRNVIIGAPTAIRNARGVWYHRGCYKSGYLRKRLDLFISPAFTKAPVNPPPADEIEDRIAFYEVQISRYETIKEIYRGTPSSGTATPRTYASQASREADAEPAVNPISEDKLSSETPVCPTCKGEGVLDLPFGGCQPCPDCQKQE